MSLRDGTIISNLLRTQCTITFRAHVIQAVALHFGDGPLDRAFQFRAAEAVADGRSVRQPGTLCRWWRSDDASGGRAVAIYLGMAAMVWRQGWRRRLQLARRGRTSFMKNPVGGRLEREQCGHDCEQL